MIRLLSVGMLSEVVLFVTLLVSVTFIVERAFKGCTFFEKIFFFVRMS